MVKRTYIDPKQVDVDRGTLRRIARHLAPYRGRAFAVAAIILACAVLNLAPQILVKQVLDHALPEKQVDLLLLLCAGMIAGPLVAGALSVAQKYLVESIGERVMVDLRVALYDHMHKQPLGYFSTARPGEVVSHVLNDVQGVGSAISGTLVKVVDNSVQLAATCALLFALDWRLTLVALAILPAFIVPTRRVGAKRKALKRQTQAKVAEMTGILTETLTVSGALLVKVFGAEKSESSRLRGKAEEVMRLSLRQVLVGRWFQMMLGTFENAGPALIWMVGGVLVIDGVASLGTVVAFVTVLKKLYGPASSLAGVHVDMVTSYAYFERIFDVLDEQPSIRDAPDARALAGEVKGELVFDHVTFRYEGRADTSEALHDIHVRVPAGAMVAIVGPSGAGKTTLVSLVPRLNDPSEGSVALDGQDLRRVTMASLRAHIGVVTQETFLLNAPIRDNLRYGRPDAPQAEVEAAARAARIHDVIAAMPKGYDTVVGDRGYRLSGGERQRIAIARVLLKDPRILILDEATSALDSQNEALIQEALEPLLVGRTSLVIAHRLSTVRRADLILVMERGRLVEQGTHEALLAKGGLYARLHATQFGTGEKGVTAADRP
jgi:ATP-binding cassette subfamily B protein